MFVSIYYKPSLFNAHTMILIVHIFMNVNKLCLNQKRKQEITTLNQPLLVLQDCITQAAWLLVLQVQVTRPQQAFCMQVTWLQWGKCSAIIWLHCSKQQSAVTCTLQVTQPAVTCMQITTNTSSLGTKHLAVTCTQVQTQPQKVFSCYLHTGKNQPQKAFGCYLHTGKNQPQKAFSCYLHPSTNPAPEIIWLLLGHK